ncbi:Vacuolar protein sorting-associated protein 35, partial [Kappamyces sp. JEL0680]
MYQGLVLPSLLEEIVGCRDVIAQEYLLDVIIQAFPDEFHLQCLDMYLSAVAGLHPTVNVKTIVITLIDRFAGYAMRAREEVPTPKPGDPPVTSAIPDDLFDIFWEQIQDLIEARPEFTIEDVISLYASVNSLALNCYPDELEYVDRVLGMTHAKVQEALKQDKSAMELGLTKSIVTQLLLAPVTSFQSRPTKILDFPSGSASAQVEGHAKSVNLGGHFTDLLFLQSFGVRRQIAHAFAKNLIKAHLESGFVVSSVDGVNFVLGEVCSIMVRDQIDGNLFGSKRVFADNDFKDENEGPLDWEDAMEEQTLMAQMVHVFKSAEQNVQQDFL